MRTVIVVPLALVLLLASGVGAAGTWTTATLSQGRTMPCAIAADGKVFFAGGWSDSGFSNVVDMYDSASQTWSTAALSQARCNLAAAAVGNQLLFAGGNANNPTMSDVVDIYDTATGTWSTANLSQARRELAGAAAGGQVFFGGGQTANAQASAVVDIYDATSRTWSTATLSEGRRWLSAAGAGDQVLFAGGFYDVGPNAQHYSSVVDIYNTTTHTWSTASLSQARAYLSATAAEGKVFFAGGWTATSGVSHTYSNVVDIYDTATGTWSSATLSQGRSDLAAAAVGDEVLFAGGLWGVDVVDIYHITTNAWNTATLSQGRCDLAAAATGRQVFFAGGNGGSGLSNVVDIYTIPEPATLVLLALGGLALLRRRPVLHGE